MPFYAVRRGAKRGIFNTWDEVRSLVTGYSGAEYKKFDTLEEAENYVDGYTVPSAVGSFIQPVSPQFNDINSVIRDLPLEEQSVAEGEGIAWVDGSFKNFVLGYGCILKTSATEYELYGADTHKGLTHMRNVGAELLGAFCALHKARELGLKKLILVVDYEGLMYWGKGEWSTNNRYTTTYYQYCKALKSDIEIEFKWVKGHTGVSGNVRADRLAAKAISRNHMVDSSLILAEAEKYCQERNLRLDVNVTTAM